MAWLYKRGGVWWIGWRHDGKQFLRSTEHTEKSEAQKALSDFKELQRQKKRGTLTDEYFALLTGKKVERPTLASYLQSWLREYANANHATKTKYAQVAREFLEHTKAEETGLLLHEVTPEHLKEFFAWKRERASASTVAGFRRVLRSIFLQAQEEGKTSFNPVQSANRLKNRLGGHGETVEKRPFTIDEINALVARATPFWRYMVRLAFFTGMRMGDAITLRRINVDFAQGEISWRVRKTGETKRTPMHPSIRAMFAEFPKGKAEDFFWPDEAARYEKSGASSFSQEFYDLMASAGIVSPRDPKKESKGTGRAAKRQKTIIGFHNIRHTFISMLKIAGAPDSVAKELAGHRTDAMSAQYTHLPQETLAAHINNIPHV